MKKRILDVLYFLFILLFMYAAVSKLTDYRNFKIQLGQSPILAPYAHIVIWLVPTIEIAICVLFAFPKLKLFGLYCFFGLMTMFTAYIIAITQFSSYIPCSCGGVLENMTWNQHLVFNTGFIVMAQIAIIIYEPDAKKEIVNKQLYV